MKKINNWGWKITDDFNKKTIKELLKNKYKKFDFLKENIILNNKIVSINQKLNINDQIFILDKNIDLQKFLKDEVSKIIHETSDFLIVYKGFGVVTHPDNHHSFDTLLNLIEKKLSFEGDILKERLGVVHRLDKPTTGILIFAKNIESYKYFRNLMEKRKISRKYLAIVKGIPEIKNFIISAPLVKPGKNKRSLISFFGNNSITNVSLIKKLDNFNSLLKIELETGRTHQIRSHLKFIGIPILNDKLYNKGNSEYIFLHAYKISFISQRTLKKIEFSIKEPIYFLKKIKL